MAYDKYNTDNRALTASPHFKRLPELVNLLIKLTCEESEIVESSLFTETQKHLPYQALSQVVYILYTHYNLGMTELHKILFEKGYPKSRATLYNHLKGARRKISQRRQFYHTYEYILDESSSFIDSQEKSEKDNLRYLLKGRIFDKLSQLKSPKGLKDIEAFLNTKIYEEKTEGKEANKRQEAYV